MDNKKQIVFFEGYSTALSYKIAKLLKENGYETVLIRLMEQPLSDKKVYNNAYNMVVDIDLKYYRVNIKNFSKIFISILKKTPNFIKAFFKLYSLRPYAVIGRAPLSIPAAAIKIFFNKYPFIYFPYDITAHRDTEVELRDYPKLEHIASRYCLEKSDGILYKGPLEGLKPEFLNKRSIGDNLRATELQLSLYPYCSSEYLMPINNKKLSKKDKKIHLVFVGGVAKYNKEYYQGIFDIYKFISDQEMHVYFYHCFDISNKKSNREKAIKEFFEANKDYKNLGYFHFLDFTNIDELAKEISKYDFGLNGVIFKGEIEKNIEPKFGIPNKISNYLEAGLPFFYDIQFSSLHKLMKKYNLELTYPENWNELKKKIQKLNYKQLQKKVVKMRKDFLIGKHLVELEEFLRKVNEKKKRI